MSVPAVGALGSAVLILATALVSCEAAPPSPTAQPSGVQPTAVPAPATSPGSAWGPLAVIPPQDGADTARTEGTLLITDACVYLVWNGERTLLFWPADRTSWSEATRAITFRNFDGSTSTVTDGTHVVLGGGGDNEAESGISGQVWASKMTWIARPDPSCSAAQRWGVGAVQG